MSKRKFITLAIVVGLIVAAVYVWGALAQLGWPR